MRGTWPPPTDEDVEQVANDPWWFWTTAQDDPL